MLHFAVAGAFTRESSGLDSGSTKPFRELSKHQISLKKILAVKSFRPQFCFRRCLEEQLEAALGFVVYELEAGRGLEMVCVHVLERESLQPKIYCANFPV